MQKKSGLSILSSHQAKHQWPAYGAEDALFGSEVLELGAVWIQLPYRVLACIARHQDCIQCTIANMCDSSKGLPWIVPGTDGGFVSAHRKVWFCCWMQHLFLELVPDPQKVWEWTKGLGPSQTQVGFSQAHGLGFGTPLKKAGLPSPQICHWTDCNLKWSSIVHILHCIGFLKSHVLIVQKNRSRW